VNRLKQLESFGQSIWLDDLKRDLIASGKLRSLIERDGLKGITSNPSIFEKAIAESDEYAGALKQFQSHGDHRVMEIYEHLAFADIRDAADILRTVYDQTGGRDGYVSLECSPYVANDTEATVAEAKRLWAAVGRPNLMVKVPGTPAGIPAIRELIGAGLNINITLLFSIGVYEKVAEAYIAGLEEFANSGGDVSRIASVASFFVSRIDSVADKKLDARADKKIADALRGRVAIANAKLAYERYKAIFSSGRWQHLAQAGAETQRLLWASTSTKNPAYKDTIYVEALVGPDTVNTMPPATMDAFRDHGNAKADAIEDRLADAHAVLETLDKQGISLKEITDHLVIDGVQQFADAFDKLCGAIARKRRELIEGDHAGQEISAGSSGMQAAMDRERDVWQKNGLIRSLWSGDPALWTNMGEEEWVGWLQIIEREIRDVGALEAFARNVKGEGFRDAVLLEMGGSSLGPEVIAETFGRQAGWPLLHVLDSTDPAQIRAVEEAVQLEKTIFIVSSKSGSTVEPNILLDYFFERIGAVVGRERIGEHFVAVTDPGSSLERRAKQSGFRHIFYGSPGIGGRYSVLSNFGIVPAALMGIDIKRLLQTASVMERSCGPDVPPTENPGVQLGIALGVAAASFGRNKVTIVASPKIDAFGAWLEQLLAESTGKNGRGLIPLTDEPLGTPDKYGADRFFVYVELEGQADPRQREAVSALEKAGHPVARITVKDIWHIGQEFFRWEIATAVAGAVIGINPFDQPDVEASKVKTAALTSAYEKTRELPLEHPLFRENGIAVYADRHNASALGRHNTLQGILKSYFDRVEPSDYVALLAYIERNNAHMRTMSAMRESIRDKTHAATCLGFGPRFQHSTGQAYKGGPNTGVFIQITSDDPGDIEIPGHRLSFGVVKAAQAQGDLDVLVERGRRALRIHLKDVDSGLSELQRAVAEALP
jgi:transaldolase / glucose-6-phosphate isomerase